MIKSAAAAVVMMSLAGCATKQFPQAAPLSSYEADTMDCREIELELARADALQDALVEEAQIDGRSVLGFLGDFGIGNAMARSSAETTIRERRESLTRLQSKCRPV